MSRNDNNAGTIVSPPSITNGADYSMVVFDVSINSPVDLHPVWIKFSTYILL